MDIAELKEYTRKYWSSAKDTHVAEPDYYQRAAAALQKILSDHVAPGGNVLDVGCGNGECTAQIAGHAGDAGRVLAFDISEHLLDAARERCRQLPNASFFRTDLSSGRLAFSGQVDAVFCMGVFACLPEPRQMLKLLGDFNDYLVDGGVLVLRESTMVGDERYVRYGNGHLGYYRNKAAMLRALSDAGFTLIDEIGLKVQVEPFNHYFVLRKSGQGEGTVGPAPT